MVVKHTYKPRNENGGVLTKSWGRERGQQADGYPRTNTVNRAMTGPRID